MNQTNIICDLITWIEKNLEQPLSIDHVALKSGYSKWHLQRMFKKVTGQILGTYIRHRRLTHAALALRLTSKPILDIAMQYRFDSQQTFTRSFKKQFNTTPANYRRSKFWDPSGLKAPIELDKAQLTLPEPMFVNFPEQIFWGITYKNNCNLNELLQKQNGLRERFFRDYFSKYFKNKNALPNQIFTFGRVISSQEQLDEQEMLYTIALEHNDLIEGTEKYVNKGGLYVCFKYIGSPDGFLDFVSQIYFSAIPMLNVKLRSSEMIEIHYNHNNLSVDDVCQMSRENTIIECDYCVPIITQNELELLKNSI